MLAVDLCAYAIMNNRYHIVVRVNAEEITQWSDEEVAKRWVQASCVQFPKKSIKYTQQIYVVGNS